jgi:hypothetical protein
MCLSLWQISARKIDRVLELFARRSPKGTVRGALRAIRKQFRYGGWRVTKP